MKNWTVVVRPVGGLDSVTHRIIAKTRRAAEKAALAITSGKVTAVASDGFAAAHNAAAAGFQQDAMTQ